MVAVPTHFSAIPLKMRETFRSVLPAASTATQEGYEPSRCTHPLPLSRALPSALLCQQPALPAPCTLHPAPCTLHPAPCALGAAQRVRLP